MLIPQWTNVFELNDPGVTHGAVEVRYPFVDLRLVEYLLAIPVFPWAYQKMLSRKLLRHRLPPDVLPRPKTPLSGDPAVATEKLITARVAEERQVGWTRVRICRPGRPR
jgi:asparagine synthase (glutamine-hydrolysing)